MGLTDKLKNGMQKIGGRTKDTAGAATGNKRMQAEGKADHAKGSLKNAAENVKDAGKS